CGPTACGRRASGAAGGCWRRPRPGSARGPRQPRCSCRSAQCAGSRRCSTRFGPAAWPGGTRGTSVSQVASATLLTRTWCTQPCGRPGRSWAWLCLRTRCGACCGLCMTSKRPPWCQCLLVWAHWISRASGPTLRRWMRCLCCPWPTCCRRRIRAIPTSAGAATSATHFLSSYTDHTGSGGSRLSSLSLPCSCWHLASTSPAWPFLSCPGAEGLPLSSPASAFTLPGQRHSQTE
ncbi:mitochondrial coenzyme A diphosphatase NUDT8 isoform 1, partial [Daubentonia madagascariensis]